MAFENLMTGPISEALVYFNDHMLPRYAVSIVDDSYSHDFGEIAEYTKIIII